MCVLNCGTSGTRQKDDDSRVGVCGCYDDSAIGYYSSSAGGENQSDTNRASSVVSARVRQGRWKFYAVKKGRRIGIFGNWPECEKQVRYYSGVVFKGFNMEEEAVSFMGHIGLLMYKRDG